MFCAMVLVGFSACSGDDYEEPDNQEVLKTSERIYVGVVAFNESVKELPITNDLEKVRTFINQQTNDKDATAFAYSVSRGVKMFDASGLPNFDKIFMLNFSDGTDNRSNMLWGEEGRMVAQNAVYEAAQSDLKEYSNLSSYAIGFGDDAGFKDKMKKIVTGGGEYQNAYSSSNLYTIFNDVANSIISGAKNITLQTNPGYFSEGSYKYFKLQFRTIGMIITDYTYVKMEGNPSNGYTLSVIKKGNYVTFDTPLRGTYNQNTKKVELPLNNLKFIYDNKEKEFKLEKVEVSYDDSKYYEDVEDASSAESISQKIGVVLVLDCSSSMGNAFEPMKEAAISFLKTLNDVSSETQE